MDDECRALLQLHRVPGVGPLTAQALLRQFSTAVRVLNASDDELQQVDGVGAVLAGAIRSPTHAADTEAELARCRRLGVRIVTWADPDYPPLLTQICDPPLVLYVRGELTSDDALALAVVGTRHASHYGLRQTERLTASLVAAGLTIVSGLARGVDAAAHRTALAAGGRTVAVLAGGLADIYPPQHRELAEQILRAGALVSEVPLTTQPRRGCFPRRNRLISGLSLGVLVTEAASRSGALITARMALEQGREVFAIPGPIDTPNSQGCHALLRDGAKLVQCIDDLLEELGPLHAPLKTAAGQSVQDVRELRLNPQERQVMQAIGLDETLINDVVARSGLPVQRVLATLSVLETRHLIRRKAGDRVARRW